VIARRAQEVLDGTAATRDPADALDEIEAPDPGTSDQ
jgi:hypothetical protein